MTNLTVIIATYNSERTLVNALNSLIKQTYSAFECIVIDGNSTDGTIEIIKNFEPIFNKKGIRFQWISEQDEGIYDAWNKGISLAKGDWISFLGSDDTYLPNALSEYAEGIARHPNYDLVYSNVRFVNGKKTVKVINGNWSWKTFRRYMNIAHVGSFSNRRYFEKYGLFDINYKICGDYEALLRVKDELKSYKIEHITAIMASGGTSTFDIKEAFKETLKAKNETAGVNIFICTLDYYWAFIKVYIKTVLYG